MINPFLHPAFDPTLEDGPGSGVPRTLASATRVRATPPTPSRPSHEAEVTCLDCRPLAAQPFLALDEALAWLRRHVAAGDGDHLVVVRIEGTL